MMSRMGSTPRFRGGTRSAASNEVRRFARGARICATVLATGLALASVTASTSNSRINERVAAVYDFAVVDRADRLDHIVAFVAFSTPSGTGGIAVADILVATAERTPGIDPGTARATAEPPALSFSYDARYTDLAEVLRKLAAAAPVPVQFALIQSIRPAFPSPGEPALLDLQR
jgi:hypothetical protein